VDGHDAPSPRGATELHDLDEVPARVVEDGGRQRAGLHRLLRELDAEAAQARELGADVADRERRDPVLGERLLERSNRRVRVRLEQQLDVVGLGRRDDGQPTVLGTSVFFR
jgi:hypothetical protein